MRVTWPRSFGFFLLALVASPGPASATGILHSFAPDGFHPSGAVLADGGFLYGTTWEGGPAGKGVVFSVRPDGTGYTILHTFRGGPSDGANPVGSLVIDAGYLYGVTTNGGTYDKGTVFKVWSGGGGTIILHSFAGLSGSDGAYPAASLLLDGVDLYGTTPYGGSGYGVVFKVSTTGGTYSIPHTFAGGPSDGAYPLSSLERDLSSNLYGTTSSGGSAGLGTVFSLPMAGTGTTLIHSFTGAPSDGASPNAGVVLDIASGYLYGTTTEGGTIGAGTVFKVKTNATSYSLLRSLAVADGINPYANLEYDGAGHLYGTARYAGPVGGGTVFEIGTDGSGFSVLTALGGATGTQPVAPVVLDGSGGLIGTAFSGTTAGTGTVFRVTPQGTGFLVLHAFGPPDGDAPNGAVVLDGAGNVYGTTFDGGLYGFGTIFKVASDGSGYAVLHDFQGVSTDGAYPSAGLVLDGTGHLYGTTTQGGASNQGTVFSIATGGSGFTLLHSFSGGDPHAELVLDGSGYLYGTTELGGASNLGTVFRIQTDGSLFEVLHSFAGAPADGALPVGPVVFVTSTLLYGTTFSGGSADAGTIYAMASNGAGYMVIHSFSGGATDGARPYSGLVFDGTNLYGTTSAGGASDRGVVFSAGLGTLTVLHSFTSGASDGDAPRQGLWLTSVTLYGTSDGGGASNAGTAYRVLTSGGSFTLMHSFAGGSFDGAYPSSPPVRDGSGDLYGVAQGGGSWGSGVVYRLPPADCPVAATLSGDAAICQGSGTTISAALTGTPPWSVTWSDGFVQSGVATSPATRGVFPAISTTYTVAFVADAVCTGSASGSATVAVKPTPAVPVAASDSPVCAGASLHLSASSPEPGATFLWSGPNGFTSATQNPVISGVTTAATGPYFVTVLSAGGCPSPPGTLAVTVNPDTAAPVVTAPAPVTVNQALCCGTLGGATSGLVAALNDFVNGGSASDDCDPAPARLAARAGGSDVSSATCFEAGITAVSFRFQDSSGKIGLAASDATVRMFGDLNSDAAIDPSDMVVLRSYFNFAITPGTPPFTAPLGMADLTHDGAVDPADMVVLRSYFNFAVSCLAP